MNCPNCEHPIEKHKENMGCTVLLPFHVAGKFCTCLFSPKDIEAGQMENETLAQNLKEQWMVLIECQIKIANLLTALENLLAHHEKYPDHEYGKLHKCERPEAKAARKIIAELEKP
jgi:hypothetical protein